MNEHPRLVMPDHLKGHRFVIHVAGWPIDQGDVFHPDWRYQYCLRCGCPLNIVSERFPKALETGELFPYILGPTMNGSSVMTETILVLGDLCERADWTPYRTEVGKDVVASSPPQETPEGETQA